MNVPQHTRPLWLGALLASLAPPLCLLVAMFFSRTGDPTLADMFRTGSVAFLVAFPVSLVAMLAIGLPFVLWLRSHNALSSLPVCIGAVVIGATTFGLLALLLSWDHRLEFAQLAYGAAFGLVSGIAFCVGAGPNNSFKPKPLRSSKGMA